MTTISDEDQAILDSLCPRISSKEMNNDNEDESFNEDGQNDGSNTPFIKSFLTFLYSGNMPNDSKTGRSVKAFIRRLQEMGHLEKPEQKRADMVRNLKEYTPSLVVRSVSSQLSAELRRHYRQGTEKLYEKVSQRLYSSSVSLLSSMWRTNSNSTCSFSMCCHSVRK